MTSCPVSRSPQHDSQPNRTNTRPPGAIRFRMAVYGCSGQRFGSEWRVASLRRRQFRARGSRRRLRDRYRRPEVPGGRLPGARVDVDAPDGRVFDAVHRRVMPGLPFDPWAGPALGAYSAMSTRLTCCARSSDRAGARTVVVWVLSLRCSPAASPSYRPGTRTWTARDRRSGSPTAPSTSPPASSAWSAAARRTRRTRPTTEPAVCETVGPARPGLLLYLYEFSGPIQEVAYRRCFRVRFHPVVEVIEMAGTGIRLQVLGQVE